ncbi:hypothetical protein PF005_g25169 [Phytophthora fragariae]|uniref:Uncharacterized protein n=1 Tax=Phytophthora fragariae TaxID=53985 RepID=A0A6A3WIV0_9STRA|nr:hypothetical protein PF003_g13556 [Phytophthora fragariae]KAE8923844.1 hypothetical protein PF009_g25913 [Phytophthora fragariae]KAE8976599.1 hypothetical protein PF011_g23981 [Phytophthora fragariae]KAE9074599.1 hypothetical protein PF007_g25345 [Phytophthora fragariae]KAE9095871.1 hypothetical protein PF006_g23909 [Phytophthora fragariae]
MRARCPFAGMLGAGYASANSKHPCFAGIHRRFAAATPLETFHSPHLSTVV